MINAVIIDNELSARRMLKTQLNINCPQISIIGEADGVYTGIELIKKLCPQLIFLDIQMKDGSGFDLIEKFSLENLISFKIIFITAYDHFAIKAIKYSALDYLLKPTSAEDLVAAVKKAIVHQSNTDRLASYEVLLENSKIKHPDTTRKIVINTIDKINICKVEDIISCESERNYTLVNLKSQKKILTAKTLKEYEELLKDDGFLRVHHSHLINVNHAESYLKSQDAIQMSNGSIIPVSRSRKEDLLSMLSNL